MGDSGDKKVKDEDEKIAAELARSRSRKFTVFPQKRKDTTAVVIHAQEPVPAWLIEYEKRLGDYELEPESDEEESRFREELEALLKDKQGKGEETAEIETALDQLERDKAQRDTLKAAKKLNENLLKAKPKMPGAEKKKIERNILELNYRLQKVSADSVEKKKLYTQMRMNKLFSGKNEAGRKVLHATARDSFVARKEFMEFLKKNKDMLPREQVVADKMGQVSMKTLLTDEGLRLYRAACVEEGQSTAFRDAVFVSSTRTYGGRKWYTRLIGWMGGPSSIGKSYAIDEAMKAEIIALKPGEKPSENHVVCIDGGVERNVSQMRQLVLQLGLAKGFNITDLEDHSKGIKTKAVVKEAALQTNLNMLNVTTFTADHLPKVQKEMQEYASTPMITQKFYQVRGPSDDLELLPLSELIKGNLIPNKIYLERGFVNSQPHLMYSFLDNTGNPINGSIPLDFALEETLTKDNLRDHKFEILKKIKVNEEDALSLTSGYNRLKRTVNIMGNRRAFRTAPPEFTPSEEADLIRPNNRNIDIEGKEYDPRPFDFGVHESNRAREWFIKNIVKNKNTISERYVEITNDLVYIKKDPDTGLWVEASSNDRFDDPDLIRTNLRIFFVLKQYENVTENLYPSDLETTVWVRKNDWQNYQPDLDFEPQGADKANYVKVSLAAFIVAMDNRGVFSPEESFDKHWDETLRDNFDTPQFKKAIVDAGGNPGRSLENRADPGESTGFVAAAIKSKATRKPTVARMGSASSLNPPLERGASVMPSLHARSEADSQPVFETFDPNHTLETLKDEAEAEDSDLQIKITGEKKDSNKLIKSLKFESNDPHESKHVKFEAELTKKDVNKVVYKIQPGHAGKNSSQSPAMKATYALLVKVAFEAHFANPKTTNRQFIISVLPNLGEKREEGFIHAIIEEAKSRGLNQAQIKLMVPTEPGSKILEVKPITELPELAARTPHRPT